MGSSPRARLARLCVINNLSSMALICGLISMFIGLMRLSSGSLLENPALLKIAVNSSRLYSFR